MRAAAALAVLALVAAASASLVQREDATVSPSAKAPPVTLAAGATGTTTLGTSLTSAATTRTGLPALAQEVLLVKKGTSGWDIRMRLNSATGFGALDSATVQLVLGATTQTQAVVTLGAVTQTIGTAVNLPSTGGDLSVKVLGTKLSAGPSTLAMTILAAPTGSTVPALSYTYTLTAS
ncbi:MAG: hypothetical protein ABR562_07605 [Thermoplasmatota archaeon]|nr:hypothetical protein [Halobacteriales archaeon]